MAPGEAYHQGWSSMPIVMATIVVKCLIIFVWSSWLLFTAWTVKAILRAPEIQLQMGNTFFLGGGGVGGGVLWFVVVVVVVVEF